MRTLLAVIVLMFVLRSQTGSAQKTPSPRLVATFMNSALTEKGEKTLMIGFDISPDASQLAVLYAAANDSKNTQLYNELRLAVWDTTAKVFRDRILIARSELRSDVFVVGPDDVRFTDNGKYLVVLGLKKVWTVDSRDRSAHASMHAVPSSFGFPLQILPVSASDVAITFSPGTSGPFHTVLYEASSGREGAHWDSDYLPQSISPDSRFAAGSDQGHFNSGGISNIAITNSGTGRVDRTIPVDFSFPRSWLGRRDAHGKAVVEFIGDGQILVAPDGSRDSAGHHSGDGVEVFDAKDGHLERKVTLDSYGPTDTVAESADRKWIALESVYAKSIWFQLDSADPSHYVHTLRLLRTDGSDSQSIVSWPSDPAGEQPSTIFAIPPRVSSAGPTAGIAVKNEIYIFTKQ